jgi:hypothetical protein
MKWNHFISRTFLKPISPQTHPGCGHLTLKTSRKSLPFTVYLYLKQSENLGRPTPQKHGFPHFFYFFSCTPRATCRQIGVCSSFSCRLSATVTKRHAKGGSQKTAKSTKSRFFFEFLLFVPVGLRCTKTPHLRLFLWNECDKIWVCQPKWSTTIMSPWDC